MSEVKLVIRDANEDRSGTAHGLVADWFIAALSADPVSLAELDAAVDRFALESPARGHFPYFRHWLDAEPWDAGLVVIDLAARLVVINSTYSSAGRKGVVIRHNIRSGQDDSVALRYRLADEWMFLYDTISWEGTASIRRQQRADQPETDLREIFYGEPMLRSIINGCRKQFAHRDEIAQRVHVEWIEKRRHWNERYATEPQPDPESLTLRDLSRANDPEADIEYSIYYDTIRDIHADWLMSPCAELNDQLPRTVMLRDRERLSSDMSDREEQWSTLEQCPPGISPESHAFQFSGFNTNEIVMYYDYVREVAWSCWDRLRTMSVGQLAALENSQIQLDEFIGDEVTRLRQVGEAWLDSPWEEDPRRTPRGIINLERRRQPNGGQFHPIDPDCPCCQALAAMPGIGFWHIDGCNMDDLFAFALYYDTIEAWEENQEEYRIFSQQMDREWELAKEWNLPPQYSETPAEFDDVWRLVVKQVDGDIPLGQRLNRVGHGAVSIIVQLRVAAEHKADLEVEQHIKALQIGFAQLRHACEQSNAQELSPAVKLCVTRFEESVDQLISSLNGCPNEDSEEDDSTHDNSAEAAYEPNESGEPDESDTPGTDLKQQPRRASSWLKLLHNVKELRLALRSFTNISPENPSGGWYADDVPF